MACPRFGMSVEPVAQYGLDIEAAREWARHGFYPAAAAAWLAVGDVCASEADTIRRAGLAPDDVARLRARDQRYVAPPLDEAAGTIDATWVEPISDACAGNWVRAGASPMSGPHLGPQTGRHSR